MSFINALQSALSNAAANGSEARVSTEFSMGRPNKTILDAGNGNDSIHIHTNFNGSVNVTVNGESFHFTAEQAQNLEIRGGNGHDCITSSGAACTSLPNITIKGGNGNDVIMGGAGNDVIKGGRGNDVIFGGKGDDTIHGGRGKDVIFGGKGDDTIKGGRGNDVIFGGRGDDTISGGRGRDTILGGRGDDTIHGGRGRDTIFGGRGDDTIKGGRGNDFIAGGRGDDTIFGGRGRDTIFGGRGDDTIYGGRGRDTIYGGPGDDTINGDGPICVKKPETSFDKQKGTASWENANYKITALESNSQLLVENKKTGETYRIWGDPHVDVDGKRSFDFKKDAVFKLDDGTEIHIKTVSFDRNTNFTLSSDITILDGQTNSAVQWKNLDQNTRGDMEEVITTRNCVDCNDLVNSKTGIVLEEADGAANKGFEILNGNSLEALSGSVGVNTAKITAIENALGK